MRTATRPEEGVSENVGAIMLVMIVVVAVSVIGVYIFSQPAAQKVPALNALIWNDSQNIYIRHEGGDPLYLGQFDIYVDGVKSTSQFNPGATWSIGNTLQAPIANPTSVQIVYTGSGSSSVVLASSGLVGTSYTPITTTATPTPTPTPTPVPPPTFVSAATNTDGTVITITFDKAMADPAGKQAQFMYQVNGGTDQTFSAAALDADTTKIDLTTSLTAIAYGDTVTISYTAGTVTSADTGILASFTGQPVSNNVGAPAPTVTSAATNSAGTSINITFNKAMNSPVGDQAQFTYSINGGTPQPFSAAALDSNPAIIDLTPSGAAIAYGNIVTVNYTAGSVTSTDGGILASFNNQPVTNNKVGAPPTVASAATNTAGTGINITFSKAMADPAGKQAQFTYSINGGAAQPFSAAVLDSDNDIIDLTTSGPAIMYGNIVTVNYTAGSIISADGGALASFNNQPVTNNVGAIPLTGIGAITGTPQVGSVLTAGALTPAGATVTYQWQNSAAATGPYANIPGATSSTYTVGSGDLGDYIQVIATGTGSYSGTVTSAYVGPVPIAITGIGAITGTPQVGSVLTNGTLTPSGATATYQWQYSTTSGGTYTDIPGATSSTYTVGSGYISDYIKVKATGSGIYTGTVTSAYVGPVTSPLTGIGAITGTPHVGTALTAGALTPPGATATYQWQRSLTSGGTYTAISGATANTYTPVAGDGGYYLEVVATGTGSYTGSVTSAYAGPVTIVPSTQTFLASGSLTIPQGAIYIDYCVIGGGGGGGRYGGGGGAGGFLTGTLTVASLSSQTVTIGGGGAGSTSTANKGTNGVSSVLAGTVTAIGGGGGGSSGNQAGALGGSGGGGVTSSGTGGSGTSGQGNSGGAGNTVTTRYYSGGGGGAGGAGISASGSVSGNGGAGRTCSINSATYAGGGGGGSNSAGTRGTGTAGGGNGGDGAAGTAGTANTGGGGGGGGSNNAGTTTFNGGAGGSGIVIVRYY